MILSKREKLVTLATVAVFALFLLDRLVLTPVLDKRAAMDAELAALRQEQARAEGLLKRQAHVARRWKEMLDGGLRPDPTEAENQIMKVLNDWASDAKLNLTSRTPERAVRGESLREITFRVAGTGTMGAVTRFLWHCETTVMPLRISKLQLGSRKDGVDDLSLTLTLSTLYLYTEKPAEPPQAAEPALAGDQT